MMNVTIREMLMSVVFRVGRMLDSRRHCRPMVIVFRAGGETKAVNDVVSRVRNACRKRSCLGMKFLRVTVVVTQANVDNISVISV